MDVADYCRELEAYLCRKNDGHLIRIVGPSFDVVSRWAERGVPLKVAMGGIDRYFERYYRKGPRRRPVKIDFCEADVLDVFDEWRRATGVTADLDASGGAASAHVNGSEAREAPVPYDGDEGGRRRRGPSLREHIERVLVRLSSLRATDAIPPAVEAVIDRLSVELDAARDRANVRGEPRRAFLERLETLDRELVGAVAGALDPTTLEGIRAEASADLAPFRSTMPPEAYAAALERAVARVLRERLRLPVVSLT